MQTLANFRFSLFCCAMSTLNLERKASKRKKDGENTIKGDWHDWVSFQLFFRIDR